MQFFCHPADPSTSACLPRQGLPTEKHHNLQKMNTCMEENQEPLQRHTASRQVCVGSGSGMRVETAVKRSLISCKVSHTWQTPPDQMTVSLLLFIFSHLSRQLKTGKFPPARCVFYSATARNSFFSSKHSWQSILQPDRQNLFIGLDGNADAGRPARVGRYRR